MGAMGHPAGKRVGRGPAHAGVTRARLHSSQLAAPLLLAMLTLHQWTDPGHPYSEQDHYGLSPAALVRGLALGLKYAPTPSCSGHPRLSRAGARVPPSPLR